MANEVGKARIMLVALGFAWGLTWPAMRLALDEISPLAMRATSALIGTVTIVAIAALAGRPVRWPRWQQWPDLLVLALLNNIIFSACIAFAQLTARTGRVAILVYTMPLWAALMSWAFLHERLDAVRGVALVMCIIGIGILIAPLATTGLPLGLMLALMASVSWAAGVVYMKWRPMRLDIFSFTAWQLAATFVVLAMLALAFEADHLSQLTHLSAKALGGALFSGFFGSGIAYYLWFRIVNILPTTTASLGALASPVIGTLSSIPILGEVPTLADTVGFSLIFLAAAAVMLRPALSAPAK